MRLPSWMKRPPVQSRVHAVCFSYRIYAQAGPPFTILMLAAPCLDFHLPIQEAMSYAQSWKVSLSTSG